MKIFNLFIIGIFALISVHAFAQPDNLHPLAIGEQMPDYPLTKLMNYSSSTAKFSDFRGKWVILDFWSTGCMGCIQSFPKLLSLQQKFKDRVVMIMVNSFQEEPAIRKVYERQKKLKNVNMTLPSVCGDSLLRKFFPHTSVPHTVWIDDKGVLQYITYPESLTEKNIEAVLNKKPVYMKHKGETRSWSITQPLFTSANGGVPEDTIWQSSLFKGQQATNAGCAILSIPEISLYKVVAVNQCILDLYRLAYSHEYTSWNAIEPALLSHVELQVKDSALLIGNFFDVNDEKVSERLYTYSLVAPPQTRESLQRVMQKDLDRFFGLQARWIKKKKMCMVLTASDTTKISYRTGQLKEAFDMFTVDVNNVPVSFLLECFIYRTDFPDPYPIRDETGLKGNLGHISFEADMNSLSSINQQLAKYGLKFSLAQRETDVLVISDGGEE
jgi:thiol-disulfide isomerase/thioredoxin